MTRNRGTTTNTLLHAIVAGAALVAVVEYTSEISALLQRWRRPRTEGN